MFLNNYFYYLFLYTSRVAVQSAGSQVRTVKQEMSSDLMGVENKIENDNIKALALMNKIPTDDSGDDDTFNEILSLKWHSEFGHLVRGDIITS